MAEKCYFLDPKIHRYALEHSLRELPVLRKLREETALHPRGLMQIAPEQGQLFALLVRLMGAKKALEIGVFTGYSSICVAAALPPEGKLIACDINDEYTTIARRYWQEAGVADRIELRLGPALDTLQTLLSDGHAGTFDFAFIDADKPNYDGYYEASLQLVRPGGLIVLDNMLQMGSVLDDSNNDASTVAIREMNEKIAADHRVLVTFLPLVDGITLALKV
jgi:predicted O-methyltransferase YrrM